MQRGLAFIAVSIVAGAAALGAWGTHDLRPAAQPVVAAIEAPPPRSGDVAPLASVNPGLDQVKPSPGVLTYQRLITNAESDTPEACLVFSAPLDPGIAYQDYLTIPTQPRPGLRVDQARLCVSGLAFGREHAVTVKAGLPAADGSKLAADSKLSVSFGDRPPQVAFGPGFILPRHSGDGLPVTTVNAPRLEMKLYRVGDRLLARMRQDLGDEKTVYPLSGRRIRPTTRAGWCGRAAWTSRAERNESTISLFPLPQPMGKPEPGAYLLVAAFPKVGQGRPQ
uniref:Alpha-2-macroglobulin, N-terminal:N/apple PAN n=1 Tax=Magnetospirillum gryphiswaldense TaxID=55518 RepID=A4TXX1_9PROT|nr:Alpha-2-macroglobulin, N-terminal:N/apple PAN [Magnetospirillum gryphiswaldense MSR-1]